MAPPLFKIREACVHDEPVIAEHLCQIALELGLSTHALRQDWHAKTLQFIDRAKQELQYQGFIAEVDHQVIGSTSCQLLELYPMVSVAYQKGYVWGVYVEPDYRRQGVATALMQQAMQYLNNIGCTQAVLHASESGRHLYTSLGYQESNEMRFNLTAT